MEPANFKPCPDGWHNEGLPRENGVKRGLQEGKVGYLLSQSDTNSVIEDIRFMSD